MMKGYFTFRKWCLTDLKIDIDNFLTISSISNEYFTKVGCFDGCYKINGISRYFIQKTVVGGRCMSRKNKMYNIETKLNDFGGVSLYPSAMKRLGEIGGFLRGKPTVIPNEKLNLEFLNNVDGYFIEVRVKNIPIKRAFPLLSYINKDGVRIFTNDLDKNDTFYLNKFSMEDLITFHRLEKEDYEIIKVI